MAAAPIASQIAPSPVRAYYGCLRGLRQTMRRYTPCTYIAYKTLVPSSDDDLISIASKISDFITLRFFVTLCMKFISPVCIIIPFIPFILDFGWICYHWAKGHKFEEIPEREEQRPNFRKIASLFGLVAGIVGIHYMQKLLPEIAG